MISIKNSAALCQNTRKSASFIHPLSSACAIFKIQRPTILISSQAPVQKSQNKKKKPAIQLILAGN